MIDKKKVCGCCGRYNVGGAKISNKPHYVHVTFYFFLIKLIHLNLNTCFHRVITLGKKVAIMAFTPSKPEGENNSNREVSRYSILPIHATNSVTKYNLYTKKYIYSSFNLDHRTRHFTPMTGHYP